MALKSVPGGANDAGCPGAGFVIAHKGDGIDYIVLAWWDRQNELPLRVFVREHGESWRVARGSESVCVWDLQVIGFERDAYVQHMMRAQPDLDAYMSAHLSLHSRAR
jgi:hypothetical protein